VILGAVGAGVAGLAGAAYSAAPQFWQQFMAERRRQILPAPHVPDPRQWPDRGLHAAWLGHSTVLMKIDGYTVITDPVLGSHCGIDLKVTQLGLKRLVAPALTVDQLPPVDLVLVSHAHFDHLDTPTLGALESRQREVVMAHATADLIDAGAYKRVTELRWDERVRVGPLSIQAVEVRHWGARVRTDTHRG
jgi:L-ascorbate metabolism protein UlaG (beta-lactamase superfamily)